MCTTSVVISNQLLPQLMAAFFLVCSGFIIRALYAFLNLFSAVFLTASLFKWERLWADVFPFYCLITCIAEIICWYWNFGNIVSKNLRARAHLIDVGADGIDLLISRHTVTNFWPQWKYCRFLGHLSDYQPLSVCADIIIWLIHGQDV